MNINPNLLWLGLVYLISVWLLTRGIHRHARKHRPARYIELSATPKETVS